MMMPIIRTEGEALAKEWGEDVLFFETSAKADIAVKEVMMILVVLIIRIVMFKVFETMAKKGLEAIRAAVVPETSSGCCTVS